MNIIHKNEGQKIAFNVEGTKIFFRDELMLDLSKYERDYDVEIDICQDDVQILIAGLSKYYVANIIIPARQYQDPEKTVPVPFSMDNVTLVLWALVEVE
jgi:hypothetical protein